MFRTSTREKNNKDNMGNDDDPFNLNNPPEKTPLDDNSTDSAVGGKNTPPQNPSNFLQNMRLPSQLRFALAAQNQIPQDHVYAVNLNIPQFASDAPEMWFAIAEADFTANRITSDNQKYSQTLKVLPLSISKQLWDIIGQPPAQDKYQALKNAILQRFSESRQTQLQKLLKEMTLGDRKPSQLLREMRELAKTAVTDEALYQL
ncbi:uncharacterized protein LOC128668618 [Microplitis demolitor]|uniref:uncharacterized protein LOC128668618 n=1 Tax=Microplitis demolitor TaxID=69319 RepID=UPI00235B6318|nr:uncharacterized protein LOC128668618 [Microplitis demolitor]